MRQWQSNYVRAGLKLRAGLKRWKALAYVFIVLGPVLSTTWAQETLDSLTTYDEMTYSNVTITALGNTHVSFKHADGFASVKISRLPPEELAKIGYTPPPPPKSLLDYAKDLASQLKALAPQLAASFAQWRNDPRVQTLEQEIRTEVNRVLTENDKVILYSVFGGVACIYILFCLAAVKLCRKTSVRPGLWVWLPGFQAIPLLKAAGMSPWNFFWLLIPPINLFVIMVWCFKICRARAKTSALGFLLLIPVINIFAYFYLAFSGRKYAPAPL